MTRKWYTVWFVKCTHLNRLRLSIHSTTVFLWVVIIGSPNFFYLYIKRECIRLPQGDQSSSKRSPSQVPGPRKVEQRDGRGFCRSRSTTVDPVTVRTNVWSSSLRRPCSVRLAGCSDPDPESTWWGECKTITLVRRPLLNQCVRVDWHPSDPSTPIHTGSLRKCHFLLFYTRPPGNREVVWRSVHTGFYKSYQFTNGIHFW